MGIPLLAGRSKVRCLTAALMLVLSANVLGGITIPPPPPPPPPPPVEPEPEAEPGIVGDLTTSTEGTTPLELETFVVGTSTATSGAAQGALGVGAAGNNSASNSSSLLTSGGVYRSVPAGDGFVYPWGVWASYSRTEFEDDFVGTAFDADTDSLLVGFDVSPWDPVVFGVALGYEDSDFSTSFNRGGQEQDGWSVIPYAGVYLSDFVGVDFNLSADFSYGYSDIDIDQFRIDRTGTRVSANTSSTRSFFATNLVAGQQFGELYVSGHTGLLIAREDIDGFTESNGTLIADRRSSLGQFSLGGDVGYSLGSFEPFASATYQYNYDMEELVTATAPQPANDRDDVRLGLGLRYFGTEAFSGTVEWNKILGREDFDSDTFSLIIRGNF